MNKYEIYHFSILRSYVGDSKLSPKMTFSPQLSPEVSEMEKKHTGLSPIITGVPKQN